MSRDLAPRNSNDPAPRRGGEIIASAGIAAEFSTRSSGHLQYSPCDLVGFDYVPAEIVERLRGENIVTGSPIAAWAEPPVTKRRAGGAAYQVVSAWWASTAGLVVFDATRDLAEIGQGRFRPVGPWAPRGTVYWFPGGVSAVTFASTPEPENYGQAGHARTGALTEDPLDILPEYLQSPLRGGTAGAWLETRRKWKRETVVAQRVDGGRARVLRAQREGASKQAFSSASWTVTSLDVPVRSFRQIGAEQEHQTGLAQRRQQTMPIEPPRTYW
jgi:hypothetical protein